jgi:predicted DNA-binding transcriptional regulator YafY
MPLTSETGCRIIIHFENRKAAGTENLHELLHAIQNNLQVTFQYQKYWDEKPTLKTVSPYALKEFRNRWYLVGEDTSYTNSGSMPSTG